MKNQIFIVIVGLMLVMSGCGTAVTPTPELEQITLKLNWEHSTQFIGFYVAEEMGFFADAGLTVTLEPLSDPSEFPSVPQRVIDGEFDFSLTSNAILMRLQAESISLTTIATVLQLSPTVVFARADAGIVTPADLAGRTIAVKNEGWQSLIEQLLDTVDLTIDDVIAVEAGFDMTPFYEGEIEVWAGFLTNEPIRARQQGLEAV